MMDFEKSHVSGLDQIAIRFDIAREHTDLGEMVRCDAQRTAFSIRESATAIPPCKAALSQTLTRRQLEMHFGAQCYPEHWLRSAV